MKTNHYKINYEIYSKQRRELENFEITIENLNTTSEFISNIAHTFTCNLSFFEEKSRPCIKYNIKASLKLTCQDTLEVFDYPFESTGSIIITEDDRLVEDSLHEPFICDSNIIDLRDIIKEEILLELPLAPKKESNSCKNIKKHSYYSEQENVINDKKNPFEVLKSLQ